MEDTRCLSEQPSGPFLAHRFCCAGFPNLVYYSEYRADLSRFNMQKSATFSDTSQPRTSPPKFGWSTILLRSFSLILPRPDPARESVRRPRNLLDNDELGSARSASAFGTVWNPTSVRSSKRSTWAQLSFAAYYNRLRLTICLSCFHLSRFGYIPGWPPSVSFPPFRVNPRSSVNLCLKGCISASCSSL